MIHTTKRVSGASPYEARVGFSRGAREGSMIAIAGTAPLSPDGETVGVSNPAVQARRCFEIIGEALSECGATTNHVIRTRIYLTRIEDWEVVAPVHGEFFEQIRPASTVVEVSRFIDPQWLVEIEADAVLPKAAR